MKITNTGYSYYLEKAYSENRKTIENEKKGDKESKSVKDRLELSKSSRDIISGYTHTDGDNTAKIDAIKAAIKDGSYKVSSDELADAMIKRMSE